MPLNRKRTLWSSQTDCQDTAPLIGTRLPNTTDLCFGFLIFIWNRTHALPRRQEWTPRNTVKRSASEMQGGTRNFFGQFFRTRKCTLQNLPMDSPKRRNGLSVLLVDCPFCGKTHFWRKFQLSNRRLWRLQNAWLLFRPSFCWCSHLCPGRMCLYS